MYNISDIELLNELSKRLKKTNEDLDAKTNLLKDLEGLNQKLIHAEKVKSEFLSNIRNEINNPLSSILGLSSILMNPNTDKSNIEKNARLINEEAYKLNFQLKNIFIAAEIEAGKLMLEISKINLVDLLNNIKNDFQSNAQKKNISIQLIEKSTVSELIFNDAEKLSVIFSNLLANAIEFSPINSKITILIDKNCVEIIDNGIGISSENHQSIFDRFVQLNHGSTKLYAGHGLGLAIVKDLVEMVNSQIVLKSELNNGSNFKVKVSEFDSSDFTSESTDGSEFLFSNNEDDILF